MKTSSSVLFLTVMITGVSCSVKQVTKTAKIGVGSKTSTSLAGKLALSIAVIDDLKIALVKDGMSSGDAQVIATGALQGLTGTSSELALKKNNFNLQSSNQDFELNAAVPRLLRSAIRTLADARINLDGKDEDKKKYSGTMTKSVMTSLEDKITNLDEEKRASLPAGIAKAAISSLDEAGLSGDALSSSIGIVMENAVGSLDEAGYKPQEMQTVIEALAKSTVEGIGETGLEKKDISSTMQVFVKSTVGSLDDAGIPFADLATMVAPIMSEAVGGLDELGLTGASQMQVVVGDMVAETINAMNDTGINEQEDISGFFNYCVQGALDGIDDAGIEETDYVYFMDDVMRGAVASFDEVGIEDPAFIQSLSADMISETIGYFDNVGINDRSSIKSVSEALAVGTMSALGDLRDLGFIDQLAIENTSQFLSETAVDAIYLQAQAFGFENEITDAASGFTTGMVAGLSEAGWVSSDISAVSDNIGAGFYTALANEETINQEELANMQDSIESSVNSWIAEMQIHCEMEKGVWYAQEERCEYPMLAPVAGAIGPSPEEEEICYEDGGYILFQADGIWFCDISAGGGELDNFDSCVESGYQWVNGPEGAYCETYMPASQCWQALDPLSCGPGCTWLENYCEEDAYISCNNYNDPLMCNTQATCFWDEDVYECLADPCVLDPQDPICFNNQGGGVSTSNTIPLIEGEPPLFSDATDLVIFIYNVPLYRYKIRGLMDPPCFDEAGYSEPRPGIEPIFENISYLPDGDIELCVVGGNENGNWLPFEFAESRIWIKDTSINNGAINLEPLPSETDTFLNVNVTGNDIIAYKFALFQNTESLSCENAVYSEEFNLETPISADLAAWPFGAGEITLCVIGKEMSEIWQYPMDATFVSWLYSPEPSNPGSEPPPDPDNLSVNPGADSITLSWSGGGGTTAGFWIKYVEGLPPPENCFEPNFVIPSPNYTFTIPGLSAETPYGIRICSVDGGIPEAVSDGVVLTILTTPATANPIAATQVRVGQSHSCGLAATGQAYCWGSNQHGQLGTGGSEPESLLPVAVYGEGSFVDISLGFHHSCGLEADGMVYCWGSNIYSQIGDYDANTANRTEPSAVYTSSEESFTAIAAGGYHSCTLTVDGSAYCWGRNEYGQLGLGSGNTTQRETPVQVAGTQKFMSIALGESHSCGLKLDGTAWCWGQNDYGQIGNNDSANAAVFEPTAVDSGPEKFVKIAAGFNSTCGLTISGVAHCWGQNDYGQLGISQTSAASSNAPEPVVIPNQFSHLSIGRQHTCGLRSSSSVYCWGGNSHGQIGDTNTSTANRTVPTDIGASDFISVEAGEYHSCGLKVNGQALCWGKGESGQRGDDTTMPAWLPTPVQQSAMVLGEEFTTISLGGAHSCGLKADGRSYCWGKNFYGQLGLMNTEDRPQPAPISPLLKFSEIDLGYYHTCGLQTNGQAMCWGKNDNGQLGTGVASGNNVPIPTPVAGTHSFVSLTLGDHHSCGLNLGGYAWCWGQNDFGQLGDGTTTQSDIPSTVVGGHLFSKLIAHGDQSCGLKISGAAVCWGRNDHGQIGNSSTVTFLQTPLELTSDPAFMGVQLIDIALGNSHSCGLKQSGEVFCWGANDNGQIGDDDTSTTDRVAPTAISDEGLSFSKIAAGGHNSCGLTAIGEVYCWGINSGGQVGSGTSDPTYFSPTPIDNTRDFFKEVKLGAEHGCSLTSTGSVYCWGMNTHGQIGDATTTNRASPTEVGQPSGP